MKKEKTTVSILFHLDKETHKKFKKLSEVQFRSMKGVLTSLIHEAYEKEVKEDE